MNYDDPMFTWVHLRKTEEAWQLWGWKEVKNEYAKDIAGLAGKFFAEYGELSGGIIPELEKQFEVFSESKKVDERFSEFKGIVEQNLNHRDRIGRESYQHLVSILPQDLPSSPSGSTQSRGDSLLPEGFNPSSLPSDKIRDLLRDFHYLSKDERWYESVDRIITSLPPGEREDLLDEAFSRRPGISLQHTIFMWMLWKIRREPNQFREGGPGSVFPYLLERKVEIYDLIGLAKVREALVSAWSLSNRDTKKAIEQVLNHSRWNKWFAKYSIERAWTELEDVFGGRMTKRLILISAMASMWLTAYIISGPSGIFEGIGDYFALGAILSFYLLSHITSPSGVFGLNRPLRQVLVSAYVVMFVSLVSAVLVDAFVIKGIPFGGGISYVFSSNEIVPIVKAGGIWFGLLAGFWLKDLGRDMVKVFRYPLIFYQSLYYAFKGRFIGYSLSSKLWRLVSRLVSNRFGKVNDRLWRNLVSRYSAQYIADELFSYYGEEAFSIVDDWEVQLSGNARWATYVDYVRAVRAEMERLREEHRNNITILLSGSNDDNTEETSNIGSYHGPTSDLPVETLNNGAVDVIYQRLDRFAEERSSEWIKEVSRIFSRYANQKEIKILSLSRPYYRHSQGDKRGQILLARAGDDYLLFTPQMWRSDLAVLHEVMEFLVRAGQLRISIRNGVLTVSDGWGKEIISVKVDERKVSPRWIEKAEKGVVHYQLRVLQRVLFGEEDVELSGEIKVIKAVEVLKAKGYSDSEIKQAFERMGSGYYPYEVLSNRTVSEERVRRALSELSGLLGPEALTFLQAVNQSPILSPTEAQSSRGTETFTQPRWKTSPGGVLLSGLRFVGWER